MPDFIINVKEKGAGKAEKKIKGLNKALGGLKSQAMIAAGAFLGAGALVAGIKSAVSAFGEQELAEKKLEASLGRTSQALLDQAAALQQVSTFGDETIISAQALIGAFVKDEDQIKLATKATLDLAAAKGMDLVTAADLVSKTLGSSTNALSRYGIEVTGAVGSTERLESLTGNLADVFGGQALAQSQTMTGSLQQMSNAVGDAAESIGSLLSPAIINSARFIKGAAEAVGDYLDSLKSLDTQEIINSTNQERLAKEIDKVQQKMSLFAEKNIKTQEGFERANKLNPVILQQYIDLEKKLGLLQDRYNSLNILMVDDNPMPDVIQDFGKFNQNVEETAARTQSWSETYSGSFKKVETSNKDLNTTFAENAAKHKILQEQQLKDDLRAAALSGQSASDSMKSVVRAKYMESVAEQISNIMGIVPFPFNIGVAAGAGTLMSGIFDKAMGQIPSFATGGDFVTNGEQLIRVGDNASGKERVQVTPLDAGGTPTGSGGGSVNITFNSPIMSADHTEDVIIPQIKEAIRRGADIGVS